MAIQRKQAETDREPDTSEATCNTWDRF